MTDPSPVPAKPLSFTERARREQLVDVTIRLIAEHGYAATSLARIAEAASISKAAVLYHFSAKSAVIEAAYRTVTDGIIAHVSARIESAAGAQEAVETYVAAVIDYMADHPDHVRLLVEALQPDNATGITDSPASPARWSGLADLIERAQAAGEHRGSVDARTQAIIFNGAIDAVVAESLQDPRYPLREAREAVVDLVRRAARD